MDSGSLDLRIWRILQEHTDENHRLTQKMIQDLVNRDGTQIGTRAVRNALARLMQETDEIECGETKRSRTDGAGGSRDATSHSDFYIKHPFSDELLSFLIDMVAFSEHLPVSYRQEIAGQLEKLGSRHFRPRQLLLDRPRHAENPQFFLNLMLLQEAIQKGCKVSFQYVAYGPDLRLQARFDATGAPRLDVVSPYQLAMSGTKYYLICNHSKYDNLVHYRLDRIQNVQLLEDEKARPLENLDSPGGGRLDLDEYWQQHNRFSGEVIRARLQLSAWAIGEAVDTFGRFVQVRETDAGIEATVSASRKLILQFAHNYAPHAKVLVPEDLRDEVARRLHDGAALYRDCPADSAAAAPDEHQV